MRILRTTVAVFVSRVVRMVTIVVGLWIFAKLLGGDLLGVFLLFQASTYLLGMITDAGIRGALEKRISGGETGVFATAVAMKTVTTSAIFVFIYIFVNTINGYFGADIGLLLFPALLSYGLGQLLLSALRGELRITESVLLQVGQSFIFVGIGILFVLNGLGVKGIIWSFILSWLGVGVIGLFRQSLELSPPRIKYAHSLFDFSKYHFVAASLGGRLHSWTDTLIIGLFLTQFHVTAYEFAWRMAGATLLFSRSIGTTLFPHVSNWDNVKDSNAIERTFSNALTGSLVFVIPATVGAAVFSEEIFRFVFGSEYVIASLPLVILMVSKVGQGVNVVVAKVLLGINRPDLLARSTVVFIILNTVFNLVLVWEFGLVGAAVATATSFIVHVLMNIHYLTNEFSPRIHLREIATIVSAAVGMGAIVFTVEIHVRVSSFVSLVTLILVGIAIYLLGLGLSPSFRARIENAISKII